VLRWRRHWPWAVLALVLASAATWELVRLRRRPSPPAPVLSAPVRPPPAAPGLDGASSGVLEGTVSDAAGRPVADARVRVWLSGDPGLAGEPCPGGETALLSCQDPSAALRLAALAGSPGPASLQVRTDAGGRFAVRVDSPGAFSVEALSPSGWASAERAGPGVAVQLVLHPHRTARGRVVDEGGRPVSGALVQTVSARLPPTAAVRSEADGSFRIDGPARSPFVVLAEAPGYVPSVVHAPSPEVGTIRLSRPRTLVVRVAGEAPAGLLIRVVSGERHVLAQGEVRRGPLTLFGLPPGPVQVEAVGRGVRAGPLPVRLRDPSTAVTLELRPAASVTVAVVDARGQPVAQCTVGLRLPGGKPFQTTAPSCSAVELAPVAPGEYLLGAGAPDFRHSERPVHLEVGSNAAELTLEEGPSLSGRVVDGHGRSVPGVSVVVSPVGGVTRSDADGAFRISVPGPGVYSVEAHHAEWGGAERTVTLPASDVVLELRPRSVLDLQVLAEGRPVEGAMAVLFDRRDTGPRGQYPADRPTGPDGRVRLLGFPPGAYLLGVMHPGMLSSGREEIVLREGEVTSRTVRLASDARTALEGEVVDHAGHPVPGARVVAQPFDGPPVETDAAGHFRLTALREGVDYALTASAAGAAPATASGRAGTSGLRIELGEQRVYRGRVVDERHAPVTAFRVAGVDVTSTAGRFAVPVRRAGDTVTVTVEAPGLMTETLVRPAGQEDLGDIGMRAASLVHGVVRTADGRPAAGALVTCEGCRPEEALGDGAHLSTRTDASGRFALPLLASYGVLVRLLAMKDGQLGWAEAGRAGDEATLILGDPALVRGRVHDADGKPRAGVGVVFSEPLLDPQWMVTAADGSFVGELPPGIYQMAIVPNEGPGRRTWTVRVPGDQSLDLEVSAPP
jgi:protocatechuate 3,4-dioxygenase beta subunit